MTASQPTLRETLEADPLGLATHRTWEDETGPPPSPHQQRLALLRLIVVVAAIIGLGYLAGAGETVLLVLVLLGCIVAHEFGHFIMAKAAKIKVTEFFVGFGPRLWSIRRGETEYGVKAIQLGGYCRIIGMNNLEEVDPVDEPRTYREAKLWRRLSVAVAGSTMHFLIALVVLFGMFFWIGDDSNYITSASALPASSPLVEIDGLTTGQSPAQKAGFELGDRIVAVDGRPTTSWTALATVIQASAGKRLDVTVDRHGHLLQLYPVPVNRNVVQVSGKDAPSLPKAAKNAPAIGFIGISPSPLIHSSVGQSVSRAGGAWVHISAGTLHAFGRLVSMHGISDYFHMLSSQKAADNPSDGVRFESPIGVVRLLHQSSEAGLADVLWLIAAINLSIGIFNLLPIFPLDGGHVALALYEGARSRRGRRYHADVAKMLPLVYAGLAIVVFLGASALFLDLRDLAT
jgi:membrane-associated protease RseP (regulator of RpoE activity)